MRSNNTPFPIQDKILLCDAQCVGCHYDVQQTFYFCIFVFISIKHTGVQLGLTCVPIGLTNCLSIGCIENHSDFNLLFSRLILQLCHVARDVTAFADWFPIGIKKCLLIFRHQETISAKCSLFLPCYSRCRFGFKGKGYIYSTIVSF